MDPTLLDAVAEVTARFPEMGVKKIVAAVQGEEYALQCGTKEVRLAVAHVKAAAAADHADVSATMEKRKAVKTRDEKMAGKPQNKGKETMKEGVAATVRAAKVPSARNAEKAEAGAVETPPHAQGPVEPRSALAVLEKAFQSNTRANNLALLTRRCWFISNRSGAVRGLIGDKRGEDGTLWINVLAVDEDTRGQGLGSFLTRRFAQSFPAESAIFAQVDTASWKFYSKLGFSPDDAHASNKDCTAMMLTGVLLNSLRASGGATPAGGFHSEGTFSLDELKALEIEDPGAQQRVVPTLSAARGSGGKTAAKRKKKTKPNQPCGCGSGLKTKKCPCDQQTTQQAAVPPVRVEDETVVRPGDDRPRDGAGAILYDAKQDPARSQQMSGFAAKMRAECTEQVVDLDRLDTVMAIYVFATTIMAKSQEVSKKITRRKSLLLSIGKSRQKLTQMQYCYARLVITGVPPHYKLPIHDQPYRSR